MKALLAILLFILPTQAVPSPTDITATYIASDGREVIRVEVATNGDMRISNGPDAYLLWHEGQGYWVTAGPGGPTVERTADIIAAHAPIPPADFPEPIAGPPETLSGRVGTTYRFKGVKSPEGWPPALISNDPALAPIGRAFAFQARVGSAMTPDGSSADGAIAVLLDRGAPLRMGQDVLGPVSTAPILASRFAVPAEPQPSATVREQWRARLAPDDAPGADGAAFARMTFKRGVFADGQLWLLSDSGKLTTIDPVARTATDQVTPAPVFDICRDQAGLVAITGSANRAWTVRRWARGTWQTTSSIAGNGDIPLAIDCAAGRTELLTNRRLIELTPSGEKAVALSQPFERSSVTVTTYASSDDFLVGFNAGEWGGGMRRIDRATGMVTTVENKQGGGRWCKKPLDGACDPVNGIAAMPGKPGCVVVAIGLIHMMSTGRLVTICGEKVTEIYYKPYTVEPWAGYDPTIPEPELGTTVAFFGLTGASDSAWAVGSDGLYRIDETGKVTFRTMPPFETIDGISVSFALPDMVLVRTTINQRMSLSGAVPMLVPR